MNCDCADQKLIVGGAARETEKRFTYIQRAPESWDTLYKCPQCGAYWEMTYPAAGDVCCVMPELAKISESDARTTYAF